MEPIRVLFEAGACKLTLDRPAPALVVLTLSGRDMGELGQAPFDELRHDLAQPGSIAVFIDARHGQSAAIDVSGAWAAWLRTHRARFEQVHMLTGSRFIQLSADIVRRFADLGELMRLYTDTGAFDDELASAVRRHRERVQPRT